MKYPKLTKRDISDKNKIDGVLRFITICQTLWFVINISARAGQNLAIATAELTTGAFVLCTYATMFCWAHKPADIHAPEIIECETTIAQILLEAGDRARQPYCRTPLDFVSRKEWPWSRYWSSFMNSLRVVGLPFAQTIRPLSRLENTVIPQPSRTGYHFALFLTILYLSIFVSAWNYSFPTRAELVSWRVSCLAVIGCTVFFWVVGEFTHSVYPALQRYFSFSSGRKRSQPSQTRQNGSNNGVVSRAFLHLISGLRNNSIGQDPNYDLPVKAILSLYIAGLIYAFARAYILIEDVIELRSLPISSYETVKLSKIFPLF